MQHLLVLLLLHACPGPSKRDTPTDTGTGPTPDTAGDTGSDTGAECVPPVLMAPLEVDLWRGSRYDLVLSGTGDVWVGGLPLTCTSADGRLICPFTPADEGSFSVTAARPGCPDMDLGHVAVVEPRGVYPLGERFMVALYSAEDTEKAALADLQEAGFNAVHTYSEGAALEAWEAQAVALGLPFSRHVEAVGEVPDAVTAEGAGWWDLPEEQRYWYPEEMALVTDLSAALRAVDDRPVYMYLPGHYGVQDIQYYVDALDLIGAGAYVEYQGQPHAWVRWRVESEVQAIEAGGYTVQERTPLGVVGVFNDGVGGVPDGTEVLHDHLAALAAGARGLYTFSWWHAVRDPDVGDSADALMEVATRVSGMEAVGEWILRGEDLGLLPLTITGGEMEIEVTPYGATAPIAYPGVWARAWRHAGAWTVVVVNSSEEPATAVLSGLPGTRTERVYDGVEETAPAGELDLSLGRLEARVYRVVETGAGT